MESDDVRREQGVEAASVVSPDGVPVQGSEYTADLNHYRSCASHRGPPCITRTVRKGKRTQGSERLLKAQPGKTGHLAGKGSHLTICRDPVDEDHSTAALL